MTRIRSLRRLVPVLAVIALAAPGTAQVPVWQEQGPNGIRNNGNQVGITPNSTVSGAVHTLALHPTLSGSAVIATVNGGLWRTTDSGSTWSPVAQSNTAFSSLSFGAVSYDATDSNVLVAGHGRFSSLGGRGGAQAGLLRSTDGGVTWTSINGTGAVTPRHHQVHNVYAAGSTIVAATSFADVNNSYGNIGLIRSTDGGTTWSVISGNSTTNAPNGLPGGYTIGMAGKRLTGGGDVLLTATQFAGTNGIYRSSNGGATWALVSNTSAGLTSLFTGNNVSNVKFAFGANNTAWAAVVTGGVVNGVYRSADNGATWAAASLDTTFSGETLNPGGQGGTHLSITAHPTLDNVVYVGGDRMVNSPFGSQTFRINSSLAAGSQASRFVDLTTGGTEANGTNPHADTRAMAFDAAGRVWMGNDGGVFRRDDVTSGTGAARSWVSLNPGLRTVEATGVAYDRITKALITGQQDNGTSVMAPNVSVNTAFASKIWNNIFSGDGGRVAADPLTVGGSTVATTVSRYYSFQNLGSFRRTTYNNTNTSVSTFAPSLTVTAAAQTIYQYETAQYPTLGGTIQFVQPVAVNQVEGGRVYFGTRRIYESINQASNLTDLNGDLAASAGFGGGVSVHGLVVNKMLAGGRSGAGGTTLNPNVLYVGTSSAGSTNIGGQLFVRPASGAALTAVSVVTAYSTTAGTVGDNSSVRDIAANTSNWQNVYVVTPKRVWSGNVTTGATSTWTNFTGNLTPGGTGSPFTESTGTFTTVGFFPVASTTRGVVVVGTSGGLYYRFTDDVTGNWLSFMGADMPKAYVSEIVYDVADDILVVATLGRGVWTLPQASQLFAPVPEPTTIVAVGLLALSGIAGLRRLRRPASPDAATAA